MKRPHIPLSRTNRKHVPNWYARRIEKLGEKGMVRSNSTNKPMQYAAIFMPPTLKKWGAYCFRLVRSFVLPSVQKKIQARVLKFHIWIPSQKKDYQYFFSCLNYLPLPSYAPFKG